MQIIGINGSPRKNWNSDQMLDHALQGAREAGAQVEKIHLGDLRFSGCRSCFACKRLGGKSFGRCAVADDLQPVLEKILQADGLILSMPIYFGDVPGMVRNLMERLWFPALMYRKDGAIAYQRRVKVGLIYTMNVGDAQMYRELTEKHRASFERFLGETSIEYALDTLQFTDYSLYVGDQFDEAHKRQRNREVFPEDCQRALALGRRLAAPETGV